MSILLLNRDPEPGEIGVPASTLIFLEIVSTTADIDNSVTQVFVEGVLAYSAGTFQVGFDGPGSTTSAPFTGTRRITIDPTSNFASEQEVDVRVVSQETGPGASLDTTYTFTIEDTTAPEVLSATGRAVRVVRVRFNEPMRNVDPAANDDALNPENYSLARLGAPNIPGTGIPLPQVNVEPVSIAKVDESTFDVTTDIELSFGTSYSVTVANVEDLNGNPIGPPFDSAVFIAFAPPQPARRRFDLKRMLPRMNFREDTTGDLERIVAVLKDVIAVLLNDVDRWTDILDPDIAPEPFVDAMLADLGNPFAFDLSIDDKRRLLRVLVTIYRRKGTAAGIEEVVLFFLGLTITVRDCDFDAWILGEGELGETTILGPGGSALLYSFEIVSPVTLTQVQRDQITKIANYMKAAHTHLKQFIEPTAPTVIDHWELGLSELGDTTLLH